MARGAQALAAAGYTPKVAEAAPAAQPAAVEPAAVVEPVVVDPGAKPVVGTEKPVSPPAAAPTENDFLTKIAAGKFKSAEELNTHIATLEKETKKNPFANDRVKGLNDAIRSGIDPELYWKVSSIDVNKLSPKDAMILQYQMRDGLSKEDAETLVNDTYRLDGEAYGDDDPATKTARIKIKVDANQAKEFLNKYVTDSLVPPREQQLEQQKQAWEPVIPQVVDSFKNLTMKTQNGEFTFPVSEATQVKAREIFQGVINSGMVEAMPDDKGIEFAKNVVYAEALKMELPNIVDNVVEQLKQKELTEKHNPRGRGSIPAPAADGKTGINDFLAAQKGIKLANA